MRRLSVQKVQEMEQDSIESIATKNDNEHSKSKNGQMLSIADKKSRETACNDFENGLDSAGESGEEDREMKPHMHGSVSRG